jgi:suppressor of G2 allele of SKP1
MMHKACEFTETNDTVSIMINRDVVSETTINPHIEGPRRLVLCDGLAVDLLGDVSPEVLLCTSGPRIEVRLRKMECKIWMECTGDAKMAGADSWVSDDESEQTESLLDLLSRIYKRSGDNVRRAMEKSFYESEGTVLSTDWDQVKQKKVAREE